MFKKLIKREKFILGGAIIVVAIVGIKLYNEACKAGAHYNKLADKLCSGGCWMTTNITKSTFDLVPINSELIKVAMDNTTLPII